MLIFLYQLIFGLIISAIVAFFGYLLKLLSLSGFFASIFLGSLVIAIGPWYAILLIGLLFASSAVITAAKKIFNYATNSEMIEKNNQRDRQQVLANTLPALCSLLFYSLTQDVVFLIAFASCIAGATADTWSSEIGMLSKKAPRSILSFKPLLKGQSGAISLLGSVAAVGGSLMIALSFFLLLSISHDFQQPPLDYFIIPFIAGICGSLIDSFFGATVQALYRCVVCGQITEREVHHQQATQLIKGYQWANNDMINFLTGLATLFLSLVLTKI